MVWGDIWQENREQKQRRANMYQKFKDEHPEHFRKDGADDKSKKGEK